MDKHIGEKHGHLTIIARSQKKTPQGYLYYYWCQCDCGNYKRLRYDYARKGQPCGLCEDFTESEVLNNLKVIKG